MWPFDPHPFMFYLCTLPYFATFIALSLSHNIRHWHRIAIIISPSSLHFLPSLINQSHPLFVSNFTASSLIIILLTLMGVLALHVCARLKRSLLPVLKYYQAFHQCSISQLPQLIKKMQRSKFSMYSTFNIPCFVTINCVLFSDNSETHFHFEISPIKKQ